MFQNWNGCFRLKSGLKWFGKSKWPIMWFWLKMVIHESPPSRTENFDLPNFAQKVSWIALLESRCKISMKNTIRGIQMAKYAILAWKPSFLAPFRLSLSARGEIFDLLNLAKKFLGSPSWSQGAKLVWKIQLGGKNGKTCDFCLKIVIFGPFQSPPARGNNFYLPNLA